MKLYHLTLCIKSSRERWIIFFLVIIFTGITWSQWQTTVFCRFISFLAKNKINPQQLTLYYKKTTGTPCSTIVLSYCPFIDVYHDSCGTMHIKRTLWWLSIHGHLLLSVCFYYFQQTAHYLMIRLTQFMNFHYLIFNLPLINFCSFLKRTHQPCFQVSPQLSRKVHVRTALYLSCRISGLLVDDVQFL